MTAAGAPGVVLSRALKEPAARAATDDRADGVDRPEVATRADAVAIVRRLGPTAYDATWRAMQSFTADRNAASADEIWLTEHEPVYTLGLAGRREHLLRDNGIPLVKVDRGGQITYHGPGQLVVYVLVDLTRRRLGVRALVRTLENCVIEFLETCAVSAHTRTGAPGVYVARPAGEAKIAALGLKIKNGRSYHGLALNIDMDLTPFADIDPCGYPGLAVTQLKDLGVRGSVEDVGYVLASMLTSSLPARSS